MSKTNRAGGITRRDFLNGLSMGGAALMLGPKTLLAQAFVPANASLDMAYYPPILNGIRGSHQGSFETAHALAWGGQKPK
ncbi:MAG: twin-arginine translocation signal domain-containing protein, partial [Planktomarina sp.]|nr:twin-arginine translocation signal domain-containing protein [Planktomarina sp.]